MRSRSITKSGARYTALLAVLMLSLLRSAWGEVGSGATGALSPVISEPPAQVKAALLGGRFVEAARAAAEWYSRAPNTDAAHLLVALFKAAGEYGAAVQYEGARMCLDGMLSEADGCRSGAAEVGEKIPPKAPALPAAAAWVAAGKTAYVGASSLYLRKSASAAAPAMVRLFINTPVEVLEVQGEWARVRWAGSPAAAHVLFVDPFGVDKVSTPQPPRAASSRGPTEGWLAAGFLEPAPLDAAALKAEAARLAQAGKSDEAATLLERAVALSPEDRDALRALVEAALAAKRWTAAALAGSALAGPGRPIAPSLEVESLDLAYGCRGDLAKAVVLAPSPADLKAGRAPADACAVNVEAFGPCEPCKIEKEEDKVRFAKEQREYAKSAPAFEARRAALDRLYPPRPMLHLRLRNRQAASPLAAARLFVYTADAIGACESLGPVEPLKGLMLVELKSPPLGPQEAVELWIRAPQYAGRHYGVLGEASIEIRKDALKQHLSGAEPGKAHYEGLPPIRSLTTGGDPCCCD